MTELDFDELDKAVSSLMGGVDTSKRIPGLDDPEDKVVTLDIATDDSAATTPAPVSTPYQPAESTAPAVASGNSTAAPAMRRRGQFMDVIRPTTVAKPVPSSVSRQGVTLRPSVSSVAEVDAPTAPVVPVANEATTETFAVASLGMEMESTGTGVPPVTSSVPPVSTSVTASKEAEIPENTWPDPIDFAQKGDGATQPATPGADSDDVVSNQDASSVSEPELPVDFIEEVARPVDPEPLTSPFLPDAKVEKRPLGMPTVDGPDAVEVVELAEVSEAVDEASSEGMSDNNPDTRPVEDVPATLLPDELRSDIVSLESSDAVATDTSTADVPVAAEPAVAVGGVQSIPQQYTEQPSTGNQANTPIFDTSTHTQPLEAPKKKKSIVRWIIFIFLLLVVGAAAGAAFFYFTTQMR